MTSSWEKGSGEGMGSERKRQLCESCQNYAGGCPWTEVGEDGHVKFNPVPGWTAKRVPWSNGRAKKNYTYSITKCPLYVDDREEIVKK